jgi:Mysoin-binding motif of peroxisomes
MIHWARGGEQSKPSRGRVIAVVLFFVITATVMYTYARRQWLQYLRRQSIDAATAFVESSQAFDVVASAAITLIQEVEVVSRGYRMQVPIFYTSIFSGTHISAVAHLFHQLLDLKSAARTDVV